MKCKQKPGKRKKSKPAVLCAMASHSFSARMSSTRASQSGRSLSKTQSFRSFQSLYIFSVMSDQAPLALSAKQSATENMKEKRTSSIHGTTWSLTCRANRY
jgi:hypothetical protein